MAWNQDGTVSQKNGRCESRMGRDKGNNDETEWEWKRDRKNDNSMENNHMPYHPVHSNVELLIFCAILEPYGGNPPPRDS